MKTNPFKRVIYIIDGPPASGKTTLATFLRRQLHSIIVHYNCFALFNIVSSIVLRLGNSMPFKGIDAEKHDSFLFLPPRAFKKISYLFIAIELLYKTFQFLKIMLLILLRKNIIIDEFLSMRFANYYNAVRLGYISKREAELCIRLDMGFFRIMSKKAFVKYYFLDPLPSSIIVRWKKRGHRVRYDTLFSELVKKIFPYIREYVTNTDMQVEIVKVTGF